ncbi:MAG TPA: hypothetical protein VF904_05470 [Anaeromyxobacteraceae bacterium]
MSGLLFVSQAMLETWAEQGKIEFQGDVMTLLSGDGHGRSYALEPAVRFLKLLGAEQDPNALLAKVKSARQLRELGAEHLDDSVIVGDVAYEVQPGFLAEVAALQAAASRAQAPREPAPPVTSPAAGPRAHATPLPRQLEDKRQEAEALARFLLENLS